MPKESLEMLVLRLCHRNR